jgi:hypothetical protein
MGKKVFKRIITYLAARRTSVPRESSSPPIISSAVSPPTLSPAVFAVETAPGQDMLVAPLIDVGFGTRVVMGSREAKGPVRESRLLPSSAHGNAVFLSTDEADSPYLTVDLGRLYDIQQLRLWRHPIAAKLGPQRIRLDASADQATWIQICELSADFGCSSDRSPLIVSLNTDVALRFLRISLIGYGQLWLQYVELIFRMPKLCWGFLHNFHNDSGGLSAIYYSTHPFGLFSNVSTAFADAMMAKKSGLALRAVSFSSGMLGFKNCFFEDIGPKLFEPFSKDEFLSAVNVDFDAWDVHKRYHTLPIDRLKCAIDVVFRPNERVRREAARLAEATGVVPERTIAICYRGTDKKLEVKLAPIEKYIAVADTLLKTHDSQYDVFIQTDQSQVRDAVVHHFGASARFLNDMPTTLGETAIHNLDLDRDFNLPREEFSVRMLAAMLIMSQCKFLIVHTGNIAAWTVFYRGNCVNVFQFDAQGDLIPPVDWSNNSLSSKASETPRG